VLSTWRHGGMDRNRPQLRAAPRRMWILGPARREPQRRVLTGARLLQMHARARRAELPRPERQRRAARVPRFGHRPGGTRIPSSAAILPAPAQAAACCPDHRTARRCHNCSRNQSACGRTESLASLTRTPAPCQPTLTPAPSWRVPGSTSRSRSQPTHNRRRSSRQPPRATYDRFARRDGRCRTPPPAQRRSGEPSPVAL
jgi:hypothetical protein